MSENSKVLELLREINTRLAWIEKRLSIRSKQPVTNGRTVKKLLADGTVRTYHYVPHASRANGKKQAAQLPLHNRRTTAQHLSTKSEA